MKIFSKRLTNQRGNKSQLHFIQKSQAWVNMLLKVKIEAADSWHIRKDWKIR